MQIVSASRRPGGQIVDGVAVGTHTDVVGVPGPDAAWQDHAHPRVTRVDPPEVDAVQRRGLLHPERLCTEERLRTSCCRFSQRVHTASQHTAIAIEQFQYRVERERGSVQFQPDLGSSRATEAEDIQVTRLVQESVNIETESQILVARLFMRSQLTQILSVIGNRVCTGSINISRLVLDHHPQVAIVAEPSELNAAPIG